MPFVTFTSKQPTSVISAVTGRFLGPDDDIFVVLNRLTLVSLYRVTQDSEGHDRLDFVRDFPVNGSLKYVRSVSVFHPSTRSLQRDLLFFCNIKQEIALVALSVDKGGVFALETVFLNTLGELCARQQHPGEVALCVSGASFTERCTDASPSVHGHGIRSDASAGTPTVVLPDPFVAFALMRGELFVFDVLTALGAYLLRCSSERCRELADLLSSEVVQTAKARATRAPYLTPLVLDFSEFDVRDIAFVREEHDWTLLVLYADQHGKKHVSQYHLNLSAPFLPTTALLANGGTLAQLPVDSSSGSLVVGSRSNAAVLRSMLQSNVDPSASRLCRVEKGLFVVGSQLISFITCPRGKKSSTTTKELQGTNFYVEATAVCVRGHDSICVAYNSGELLQVSVTAPVTSDQSRRDKKDGSGVAVHTTRLPVGALNTVPDDMLAVGKTSVVVTSRFADTCLVNLSPSSLSTTTTREEVLLSNCGPVIDMCVLKDGPRTSVVASTGVAEHGSLSLVRSAVSLTTDLVLSLSRPIVNVLGAGSLLILQGSCFNTFLRFEKDHFCEFAPPWSPLDRFVPLRALYLEEQEWCSEKDGANAAGGPSVTDDRTQQQPAFSRRGCAYIIVHEHGYVVLRDDEDIHGAEQEAKLVLESREEVPGTVVHSAHIRSSSLSSVGHAGGSSSNRSRKNNRKDGISMVLVTEGFIYFYQVNVLKLAWPLTCPVSCIATLSDEEIIYGEWNQHVVILNLRTQRIVSRISLPSIAHSLAIVPAAPPIPVGPSARELTIFIGLVDGSLVQLSNAAAREMAYVCVRHSYVLMHRPVELCVLGSSNSLICLGENPLIIIPQPNASFDITGFSLPSVNSCGTVWCNRRNANDDDRHQQQQQQQQQQECRHGGDRKDAAAAAMTLRTEVRVNFFFSQQDNRLFTGTHSDITKTSHIPTHIKHTVTMITYVPNWNGFIVVARLKQCDTLQFFPAASLDSTAAGNSFALDTRFNHFLDNERCVFVEPIILGGLNTDDLRKSSVKMADDYVVLVGSSFTFPDEQTSRSGRLSWYRLRNAVVASRGGRTLERVGDTDIEGPLLSCCVVPSYKGRIALGVCGCIFLYNYNPIDRTFVPEEKCRIGVTLTKLIPIFADGGEAGGATSSQSTIIAFDARCSAIVVKVDAVQGTLTVCGRDARLRGIVDGVPMDDRTTLCCSDDSLNVYLIEYENRRRRSTRAAPSFLPSNGNDSDVDDAVAEGGEEKGECRRLAVADDYHVGDLITAMRSGSFAPISLGKEEKESLLPNTFARNIKGSQVVFGTAYGAFGSVTQVNMVTYIFLKALEEAVVESGYVNGVYSHKGFRSPLRIGQELDTFSNRSFDRQHRDPPLGPNFGPKRQPPNRFCDGDRVRDFLALSESQRAAVLRAAEVRLVARLNAYVTRRVAALANAATTTTSSAALTARGSVQSQNGNVPTVAAAPAASLEMKDLTKTCNKHLTECALPNVPFKVQEVVRCVTEMKKNF